MGHRLASFVHHYGFLTLLAGVAGGGSVGQPSIFMTSTDSGTSDGSGGSGHDGGIHLGGDSGTHPGAPKSLFFVPAAATVVVDGTGNQQAKFKLEAKLADGSTVEVTPTSVEFDRPDLATLVDGSPVVATAPSSSALYGGTGTIHAIYDGKSATATLTVKVHLVAYGTGLTSSST